MKFANLLLLIACSSFSNPKSADDVLALMHKKYAGKWMKSFSFNQTTENYRNDSLIKTATWYESLIFPDKFRIDFGNSEDGNAAIFTNDSVYSFRKGLLAKVSPNEDDLTFLLGGMYFFSMDIIKSRMEKLGYDLKKYYFTTLNNKKVYVIGAENADEKTNQIWIDADKLVFVKFIKYNGPQKEEGIFSNHIKLGKSWTETSVDFYIDDHLIQKETYHDCQADGAIDPAIFDTGHFRFRK